MKEIPNQQFTDVDSTASLLTTCLNGMPPTGFDFAINRARARVDNALEGVKQGDIIKLEDADYATAVEAVKSARWTSRAKHIITFAEQFGL